MKDVVMKYGLNRLTTSDDVTSKPETEINWDHFNYPPFIRIFNYERARIPEEFRKQVYCFWSNHILIIIATIFNLITNIVATISGYLCILFQF